MSKYKKSPMHEGQNKIARLMRLDQLLRTPEGLTLKEIMDDVQMDLISKRLLQDNLKEIEEKYGAEMEKDLFRGRERLWRYKDTSFSIMKQTSNDMEIIRRSIEKLDVFKGDPRYDLLRFYLMGLEKGISGSGVSFMSFANNNEAAGLEYIEPISDAIIHKFPLKMKYEPFSRPEFEINIHPYHLRQYNNRWFVFCYVEDRGEVLNYALDRIKKIDVLCKPYIETDIDFEEYFDDIVGVTDVKTKEVERVVVKVSKKSIDYIRTKPIHWTQTELKDLKTDEYTFLQFKVKNNMELKMQLCSYGDAIEVLEPASLRKDFVRMVKNMNDLYELGTQKCGEVNEV